MERLKGEGERVAAAIRAGLPDLVGCNSYPCWGNSKLFCAFYHTFEIVSPDGRAEDGESAADAQHPKM